MAKQSNPEASILKRPGDEELTTNQLQKISVFANMKRKPNFDKFPGALILHRFEKGEVVCTQGEAGWTAFYILKTEDVLELRRDQLASGSAEAGRIEKEIKACEARLAKISESGDGVTNPVRQVATVRIRLDRHRGKRSGGFFGRWFGRRTNQVELHPRMIPIDGPTDLDYEGRIAAMYEGELFGEMSCMGQQPRSATIVSQRDCYMIEILRNILDQMQKDKGYNEMMEQIFRSRVLEGQLRNLPIFEDLAEKQFEWIRQHVELEYFEPGQVLFDEGDVSDCMYIIRNGMVQSIQNLLPTEADFEDVPWPKLCEELLQGEQQEGPKKIIWEILDDEVRQVIRNGAAGLELDTSATHRIARGLASLVKNRQLMEAKELRGDSVKKEIILILDSLKKNRRHLEAEELIKAFEIDDGERILAFDKKKWSDFEVRRCGRLILAILYPNSLPWPKLMNTVAYMSRGEILGEMGVLTGQPRSGTCVAYDHPDKGRKFAGRVEVVRIGAQEFEELIQSSPEVQRKVELVKSQRETADLLRLESSKSDLARPTQQSKRFRELGLFQGQKLMLIDLDRCTRCGDCVQACINTHDDGRSRLFLDGPRFENYLVPMTCRKCLDPVCMIGCPVGSIHRGNNKEIVIEDWCIGCQLCADQCPYDAIQMHQADPTNGSSQTSDDVEVKEVTRRAVVCDMCSSLPSQEPACVYLCPHDAAFRFDARIKIPRR